jgi:uncharacterized OB-fold protein
VGDLDPRPRLRPTAEGVVLNGQRCERCGYPVAVRFPRCPLCGGDLAPAEFGPEAVVWSATVVHVAVAGLRPPYGLAYLDLLEEGPRVLAHVSGHKLPPIGSVVRLGGPDGAGNLVAEPQ